MFISDAAMALLAVLTVTSYSFVGLLAIWGGLGRPHWFLRLSVVGGILLLLLLIPAYEPLLVFSIQSGVAILPLMLVRGLEKRAEEDESQAGATTRGRLQFSVSDLLDVLQGVEGPDRPHLASQVRVVAARSCHPCAGTGR